MATNKRIPGKPVENNTASEQAPAVPIAPDQEQTPLVAARNSRESESREQSERTKEWVPPAKRYTLKSDDASGFRLRWLRLELDGQEDTFNMESKLEEGYELVSPTDPLVTDKIARGELHVNGGRVYRKGLVLAKIPVELAEQRNRHYAGEALLHQQGVSQALQNGTDKRMPMHVVSEDRRTSREG